MKSLKVEIKFTSGVGSFLQSDTIFGQFCWEYLYANGEDALQELLVDYNQNPFIVFSDGFLHNAVCMPFLKPKNLFEMKEFFRSYADDVDYYSKIKELKKSRFVRIGSEWLDKKGINIFDLYKHVYKDEFVKTAHFIRNSINRISNTAQDGMLYTTDEIFYRESVDIYIKYNHERIKKDEIEKIFESMGRFGFGKDKSTGKGRFDIVGTEEEPELLKKKNTKTFISLSSGIPDDSCHILFGKTFTKFGKHGGTAVFGNPFKNPIILFKSGSVFKIKDEKEVYGGAVNASSYKNHLQSAYIIPLFVDVEE